MNQIEIQNQAPLLKGVVTLEFTDIRDGSKREVVKENLLTNHFFTSVLSWPYNNGQYAVINFNDYYSPYLFLSSNSNPASRTNLTTGAVGGVQIISPAPAAKFLNKATEPFYYQMYFQFPNPGAGNARTFRTVGLSNGIDSINSNVFAYTVLNSNCTQGEYEFLNLFYRIQPGVETPRTSNIAGSIDKKSKAFFLNMFYRNNSGNSPRYFPYLTKSLNLLTTEAGFPDKTIYPYNNPYLHRHSLNGSSVGQNNESFWHNFSPDPTNYKVTVSATASTDKSIGKIYQGYQQGLEMTYDHTSFSHGNLGFNVPGNIQGVFKHNSSAPGPFFDATTTASSTGGFSIGGVWNASWPTNYRATITTSGAVGVSTYKLSKHVTTGYAGNGYYSRPIGIPYVNPVTPAFSNAHGHDLYNKKNIARYSDTSIVTWDSTGVTLLNLSNGEYKNYYVGSTPNLPCTSITQCAVDGRLTGIKSGIASTKIYVADSSSGLYVINVDLGTVTQLNSLPAYAVAMGPNSNAVAILEGGAVYGPTYSTLVPITYLGNAINYSQVKYIKTDKASSIFQSAFINTGTDYYWFSNTSGALTYGGTMGGDAANRQYGCIECSDYGSNWAAIYNNTVCNKIVPNMTSIDSSTISPAPTVCWVGDKFLVPTYNFPYIAKVPEDYPDRAVNSIQTSRSDLLNWSDRSTLESFYYHSDNPFANGTSLGLIIHMTSLLTFNIDVLNYQTGVLADNGGAPLINIYKPYVTCPSLTTSMATDYGWNSSTSLWEVDNVNSKTTHATAQPALDGTTIAFEQAATGTSFVSSDYATYICCKGLMKDNATTFSVAGTTYFKPAYFEQPIDVGSTVTSTTFVPSIVSNPDFITLLNSFTTNFVLYLNGAAVLVKNTGTPNPLEVVVNTASLTFNSADVGKSLTGTISYMLHT